jgi:hypothetical protein
MTDPVNSPDHYTAGKIEAIDIIEQVVEYYPPVLGWSIGQVLRYVIRAPLKNNLIEDLSKASWYLQRAIKAAENDKGST